MDTNCWQSHYVSHGHERFYTFQGHKNTFGHYFQGDVPFESGWGTGVEDSSPGILMQATLTAEESYQQVYYEGEAEDMAELEAVGILVELEDGSVYEGCLPILECNRLKPDSEEHRYCAPIAGLIKVAPQLCRDCTLTNQCNFGIYPLMEGKSIPP